MLFASVVFAVICAALVGIPLAFIFHNVYEDGLIGRIGLSGVSGTSAVFLLVWFDHYEWPLFPFWNMVPLFVVQSAFYALFLIWHLFRFHRRVLRRSAS